MSFYAKEMIMLCSNDEEEHMALSKFAAEELPGIINSLMPLKPNNLGENQFIHTRKLGANQVEMILIALSNGPYREGFIEYALLLGELARPHFGCVMLRFNAFPNAFNPASGLLPTIKSAWQNTSVVPDLDEVKKKFEEEEQKQKKEAQSQQWASQGLCRHCGGKLAMFGRKCKSCDKQN
jgi:hypothetical protein